MNVELLYVHQQTISCYSEEKPPKDGYLWLLIERSEEIDLKAWISKFTKKTFNERHVEDLKQQNHPSFYEAMSDYDLIILRSVSDLREGPKRVFPVSAFIIFENVLITVYDKRDNALPRIRAVLTEQKRTVPLSTSVLAEFCLGFLVDRYLDIKQNIDSRLNLWQKKLLQIKSNASSVDWDALLAFKTDVRRIRMLCEEQMDTINAWRTNMHLNTHHIGRDQQQQLLVNLNDVADHANRAFKLVTQSQQELESLMQLHFTILSHRTNEIMRILALVTCIFLPPGLITGIFGMNFTYVPEIAKRDGFYVVTLFMLLLSVGLWFFFKWRKWI
jgi:Mg2+ and Co2+ transporter CorA